MALSTDRNTYMREGILLVLPVAANTRIYAGALVAVNAMGYAVPGSTATDLKAAGRAEEQVDNTGGADGAKRIEIRRGVFLFKNDAVDPVDGIHVLGDCYIVDDETVAATDGTGTRSIAGKVLEIDPSGVWVDIR